MMPQALQKMREYKVEAVYVADDIAVKDSLYTVGRRGVAGTVLVHKIAGAKAEQGASLEEVKRVAQKVADNVRSFGFALTSCTVPAAGTPTFELGNDEMEFGVGIHGEPGRKREKILSANELAERIIPDIIEDLKLEKEEKIVLLVNGFGGTPLQELYLFNNSVTNVLEKKGIIIHKTMVGNYMTSIDMAGASISLLRLDQELLDLLDAPVSTPALNWGNQMSNYEKSCVDAIEGLAKVLGNALPKNKDTIQKNAPSLEEEKNKETLYQVEGTPVINNIINTPGMVKLIDKMADIIIAHEVDFCEADRNGDGDFGMSIAKGFKQLKKDWDTRKKGNIGEFLMSCSEIIMEYCGGASGPLWGNAFRYAGKASIGKQEIGVSELAELLQAAVIGIQETGERSFGRGAKVGDKTLIDALVPAADSLKDSAEKNIDLITAMKLSADAAKEGAEKTKGFAANLGRAGTVGDRSIGYPDAGAYGIGIIFSELYEFAKDFK
ncbi:dihydroxyacetone kinase subunit DhaK [Riemerella anatipestifer]|uniref:dihydroxyacetone kinase subunit DhaK n=2 Tax=Riemerella anatipestifer TaxID=34085 RepID=UPI001C8731CD|nr:dihydroxyacetone kinase subunit DhaK [Riemerella anatipestifer]